MSVTPTISVIILQYRATIQSFKTRSFHSSTRACCRRECLVKSSTHYTQTNRAKSSAGGSYELLRLPYSRSRVPAVCKYVHTAVPVSCRPTDGLTNRPTNRLHRHSPHAAGCCSPPAGWHMRGISTPLIPCLVPNPQLFRFAGPKKNVSFGVKGFLLKLPALRPPLPSPFPAIQQVDQYTR